MEIPTIDLDAKFTQDDVREKQLASLRIASQELGCFYVKCPKFDLGYLRSLEGLLHRYFALPLRDKMENHISKSPLHRGYFPVGEENAKGSEIRDQKEGFDLALHLPGDDPDVVAGLPFHGPNVYPKQPLDFKDFVDELYLRFRSTAEQLCQFFAEAAGLPTDYFLPMVTKPLAQLRLLHYPSTEHASDEGERVGAGEHTDYGILTLLWQDNVGGLEVRDIAGRLHPVEPKQDLLFCNIGDAMERFTNGQWRAAPHRVMNRSADSRYSAAFFFDPNYHTILKPLPTFADDKAPRFPEISMGQFLLGSFDETFAYRESANAGSVQ